MPDPVPDPDTVIHDVLVDADQTQPAWVVTDSVPGPPAADAERLRGLTKKLQGADCVTVKALPAIRTVAVRFVVAVFAATLKLTAPLPVPLAPFTIVIQGAPPLTAHTHPPVVVTATLPGPPAAVNACDGTEME